MTPHQRVLSAALVSSSFSGELPPPVTSHSRSGLYVRSKITILVPDKSNTGMVFDQKMFANLEAFLVGLAGGYTFDGHATGAWQSEGQTFTDSLQRYFVTVLPNRALADAASIAGYIRREFDQLAAYVEITTVVLAEDIAPSHSCPRQPRTGKRRCNDRQLPVGDRCCCWGSPAIQDQKHRQQHSPDPFSIQETRSSAQSHSNHATGEAVLARADPAAGTPKSFLCGVLPDGTTNGVPQYVSLCALADEVSFREVDPGVAREDSAGPVA